MLFFLVTEDMVMNPKLFVFTTLHHCGAFINLRSVLHE
ncbi:hypothetical protein BN2364_1761 [Alloalcanivorax xenomutans]|nr:hypothetical protein BN2364_1761 [Alloalcanivorax xenomutans]